MAAESQMAGRICLGRCVYLAKYRICPPQVKSGINIPSPDLFIVLHITPHRGLKHGLHIYKLIHSAGHGEGEKTIWNVKFPVFIPHFTQCHYHRCWMRTEVYSVFTTRKRGSPLRISGERGNSGFRRVNRPIVPTQLPHIFPSGLLHSKTLKHNKNVLSQLNQVGSPLLLKAYKQLHHSIDDQSRCVFVESRLPNWAT